MNEHRDDLLDEIGAALSIEPTPEFAAKVRTEIEAVGRPHWIRPFTWVAGAAVAALLATLWFAMPRPAEPVRRTDRALPPPTTVVAVSPAPAQPAELVLDRRARPAARRAAGAVQREPAVIVAPDQADVFQRWMAYVRAGGRALPSRRETIDAETGEVVPLPEIVEIALAPVSIAPLPGSEEALELGGVDD